MRISLQPLRHALIQDMTYGNCPEPKMYKKLSVKLYGKGVQLDTPADGALLKMQKYQLAKTGQVILSEIWGKKGAIGIVPPEGDGALCTTHFFLFDIREDVALRSWIDLLLRANYLQPQLGGEARGSTGYAAVRPRHLLEATIPLPPLDEQEKIVERVTDALGRLDQASRLVGHVAEDFDRLLLSVAHESRMFDQERRSMGSIAPLTRRTVTVDLESSYPELGVRSFGKGTFHKPSLAGAEVGTKKLFWIEPGDLVFQIVFAWEGAVAIAKPEDAGRCGSHRFLTCVCNPDFVLAEWLLFYFQTSEGLKALGDASPGGAGRNRTLGVNKLARMEVPVPPLDAQRKIAAILDAKRRYTEFNTFEKDAEALRRSILAKAFRGEL